jgi:hypothetical protein
LRINPFRSFLPALDSWDTRNFLLGSSTNRGNSTMMNAHSTITTQPAQPQLPQLPPNLPIDPTNPLAWVIVFTVFIGTTEKPLNAAANLIRAIATLCNVMTKRKRS